jgi:hypothetical protein
MSGFTQIEPYSTGSLTMEEKLTFTSSNNRDGGNEISTRQECYFLRLPPELLVRIACLLVSKTPLTVLPDDDYSSLIPFSSSQPYLREVSFRAGLFRQICPKSNFDGYGKFGDSLNIHRITSLSVDLGNQGVWPFCALVMKSQPDLNELCIIGETSDRTVEFCASDLAKRLAQFKGRSMVFRKASFETRSLAVLAGIGGRETVTSLFFDRSRLHFNTATDPLTGIITVPLFPSVKRIKYVEAPCVPLLRTNAESFVNLFMTDCPLTHFEISFEVPACCSGPTDNWQDPKFQKKVEQIVEANWSQYSTSKGIYRALRDFSRESLQVYMESDPRTAVFIDWTRYWLPHADCSRPPFQKMQLLILRVKDIQELLADQHASEKDFCSLETGIKTHHHSVWRYLSGRYASFHNCDCVVVETVRHRLVEGTHALLWNTARDVFLNSAYRKIGEFRYFIIGNTIDGYCGVERDMLMGSWTDQLGWIHWAYKELEIETCKRVLLERGFPLE